MTTKNVSRDILLYVVIGSAIAGFAMWLGIYNANHHLNSGQQMRWIAAAVLSCWIFGTVVVKNRDSWRSLRVWALWLALLLGHAAGWTWYLLNVPHDDRVPALLFGFLAYAEIRFFSWLSAGLTRSTAEGPPQA
jgi:hypothetical protein